MLHCYAMLCMVVSSFTAGTSTLSGLICIVAVLGTLSETAVLALAASESGVKLDVPKPYAGEPPLPWQET